MKIRIIDIGSDTYTNAAGYTLYLNLKSLIDQGHVIQLSFMGVGVPSSSFLNSSFGSLIEEIGLDKFVSSVRPSDLTPTQASMLRYYIQGFQSEAKA